MTTGERIRLLRTEKGLSQEGLADALDVTRQAVSRWETDASLPDIDKLIGLCDLFGVSLDYLVRGKESAVRLAKAEAESADTPAQTYSLPISRSTIAGILCIVLGISAAPLLIFAFTPVLRVGTLLLASIPIILLAAGILLLRKKRPSLLWSYWGLLLVGTLFYPTRTFRNLSALPEQLHSNAEEFGSLVAVWIVFAVLTVGMMLWTVLHCRKTGWARHSLRWFLLSGGLFLGATGLFVRTVRQIALPVGGMVFPPLWLYLLFWAAVLSLTYCLAWLFSRKPVSQV